MNFTAAYIRAQEQALLRQLLKRAADAPSARPRLTDEQKLEVERCRKDCVYFVEQYCMLVDIQRGTWTPFQLWDAQRRVLLLAHEERQVLALKARQVGLSWLFIAYALWLLLFHPIANVLLLSVRDNEAMELLKRLRGMYEHLPAWMRQHIPVQHGTNNKHEMEFQNGSMVKSLPNTAGDSYTATFVLLDEADLYDLNAALVRIKPTIDAGGKLVAISKSDKSKPESAFKRLYRAAQQHMTTEWRTVFLPWYERPDRDKGWYERMKNDILVRTGALDELHENYPATDVEALSPRTLDKRLPPQWLQQCYVEQQPERCDIAGVQVWQQPQPEKRYVVAADPAEGNPSSDYSAVAVLDVDTWEEVASYAAKCEPAMFAETIAAIATLYNRASVLVERNNHGHAVLLWLREHTTLPIERGDDGKLGFNTTAKTKSLLYTRLAQALRDGDVVVHSFETYLQLSSIDGTTLSAPDGQHDDRAMAFALAVWAAQRPRGGGAKF